MQSTKVSRRVVVVELKTDSSQNLPEADYVAALIGFGLPESLAQAIAGWDIGAYEGALFDESHQL